MSDVKWLAVYLIPLYSDVNKNNTNNVNLNNYISKCYESFELTMEYIIMLDRVSIA